MNLTKEFIKSYICERQYFNLSVGGICDMQVTNEFCEVKPEKAKAIITALIKKIPIPQIIFLKKGSDYKIWSGQEIFYTIREYMKGNLDTLLEKYEFYDFKYNEFEEGFKRFLKSIDVPVCIFEFKTENKEFKEEFFDIMNYLQQE